jgi:hypothetical protein
MLTQFTKMKADFLSLHHFFSREFNSYQSLNELGARLGQSDRAGGFESEWAISISAVP